MSSVSKDRDFHWRAERCVGQASTRFSDYVWTSIYKGEIHNHQGEADHVEGPRGGKRRIYKSDELQGPNGS